MTDPTTKGNRAYPSLPEPGNDLPSHSAMLRQIKEALQIHERRTANYLDSFVRLREMVDLGLLKVVGNQIAAGDDVINEEGGGGSGVHSVTPRGATWVIGSGAIVVPVTDVPLYIPNAATILGVTLLTLGGPGDCVVDIWKDAFANYPPDVSDSICPGAEPTISGGTTYRDATLAGWDTSLAAGDTLHFHLESCSTFSLVYAALDIREDL